MLDFMCNVVVDMTFSPLLMYRDGYWFLGVGVVAVIDVRRTFVSRLRQKAEGPTVPVHVATVSGADGRVSVRVEVSVRNEAESRNIEYNHGC